MEILQNKALGKTYIILYYIIYTLGLVNLRADTEIP